MQTTALPLSPEVAEALDLGVVLGRTHAFGLVAGRCSAAQAEGLLRLRNEKKYLKVAPSWREFCTCYLKMSGSQIDHIIRLWEEFGPGYFEMAQLIRISSATYRAIAPSVRDGALHHNGEAIELDPENAAKLADAISELRRELGAPDPAANAPVSERLEALQRRCEKMLGEFRRLASEQLKKKDLEKFELIVGCATAGLLQIEADCGFDAEEEE